MKSFAAAFLVILGVAAGAFGQTLVVTDSEFSPLSAASWASGGVGVATARGFESLYANPAGFAGSSGSFTLLGLSPALYLPPDPSLAEPLSGILSDPAAALDALGPTFASNGLGAGATVGLGYAGHGLGLGLLDVTDLYGDSTHAADGTVDAVTTVAFIGGLAFSVGNNIAIGGAVRPMFRVRATDTSLEGLMASAVGGALGSSQIPVLYGYGVGIDFGAQWEQGPFAAGVAVKDLAGTRFYYSEDTLGGLVTSVAGGQGIPPGRAVSEAQYVVPMNGDVGIAFHPDLGAVRPFFDPSIEVDYHYIWGQDLTAEALLAGLHAGASVRLLSFLTARVGYNEGYLTFGAGFRLLFLSLDAGVFTRPGGSAGALPNSGIAADITIKF